MTRFASEAELEVFLRKLDPDYAQYASTLWQNGVRTTNQLANANKALLLIWGLLGLHVSDIQARAEVQVSKGPTNTLACQSCHHAY